MSALRQTVVGQFSRPHGLLGRIAGWIMVNRPSNRQRNEWTLALIAAKSGEHVLEVGCGPGYALARCAAHCEGATLIGLDHSQLMVNEARKRLARVAPNARVRVEQGGLDRLSEWPEHFDAIWSANVVQFFPDMASAFGEMRGALKPGGRIVTAYQPRHKAPTLEDALRKAAEVEDVMTALGFVDIRREQLDLKPVAVVAVIGRRG